MRPLDEPAGGLHDGEEEVHQVEEQDEEAEHHHGDFSRPQEVSAMSGKSGTPRLTDAPRLTASNCCSFASLTNYYGPISRHIAILQYCNIELVGR